MQAAVENQIKTSAFALKEPPSPNGYKNGTIRARTVIQHKVEPLSGSKTEEEPMTCKDICGGLTYLFCRCICKCIVID